MARFSTISSLVLVVMCGVVMSSALKCYFHTVGPDDSSASNENNKEYECLPRDKYCVDFGGTIRNPIKNVTLALRSCESDVKRYLEPISTKIAEKIDFECANADGKKKEIGTLTYWYNCCTTDDCNNAAISKFNMVLLVQLITSCAILSSLFSIAA